MEKKKIKRISKQNKVVVIYPSGNDNDLKIGLVPESQKNVKLPDGSVQYGKD